MPTNMTILKCRNIHVSGSILLMTRKSTLIEFALNRNYSLNLKQLNTAQNRKANTLHKDETTKYTVQKTGNQNKQICKNYTYLL
jgi:hypothetical protein